MKVDTQIFEVLNLFHSLIGACESVVCVTLKNHDFCLQHCLFCDGLHHHLQVTCPDAGIKIQHLWLTNMEDADDVFLLGSSPSHLQQLITAMDCYCEDLHMQV